MANIIDKEDELRREILSAAQKLFQQYGLQKTTMEDIAKALHRGRSTLYYYFKSKHEIFEAVVYKEIYDAINSINSAIEKAFTAEDKLRVYFTVTHNILQEKTNLYSIVKGDLLSNYSFLTQLQKLHYKYEQQIIKDILDAGLRNNEFFLTGKDIDTSLVAYIIVSGHRSITFDLMLEENDIRSEKLADVLNILISWVKK